VVLGDPEDEAAEFAFVGAEGVRGAVALVGEDAEVGGDEAVERRWVSRGQELPDERSLRLSRIGFRRALMAFPKRGWIRGLQGRLRAGFDFFGAACGAVDAAGVEFAMDGFEAAEGEVGVDLGGGDVGVAEEELDGAEVGAVLDHVGGATVAQGVGAGGAVVALDEEPDGLAGERHAAQGEKEACAVCGVGALARTRARCGRPSLR
jgi:hypothetical protein